MNGAELPCGSVLHVEPAESSYGKNKEEAGIAVTDEPSKPLSTYRPEATVKDKDEDLDDFFEGLE